MGAFGLQRPRLRDLRWAGVVGLLLTLSPATGAGRVWLSIVLGLLGGALVLGLRVWRPGRVESQRGGTQVLDWPGLPVALALALVVTSFVPTVVWLFEEYTNSVWRNVHGFFVPLFMYLLARSSLRRDPHPDRVEQSAWGFAFLVAGLGLAVLDAGVRSHHVAAMGLVLCLPGLSLLFLGARRTRLLAGPLALGFFALPSPANSIDPLWLAQGSAVLADPILQILGVPAMRHGTYFMTRAGEIHVSQNCSGLSTLHAALALAFALAIAARDWRGRLAPLLLAYPVTLVLNTARVVVIVWMCHRTGVSFLETPLHGFSGLVVLWSVLGLLWLSSDRVGVREALS